MKQTSMRKLLLFTFILISSSKIFAQSAYEINGTVRDSSGQSIIAATVKLISPKDSVFTRTNADGLFTFKGIKSGQFTLNITSLGYQTINRKYLYNDGEGKLNLDAIVLKTVSKQLNEVVISGTPAVTVKEDTVEYRASDYKLKEGDQVEELLKKLPGVEVDANGNVKAQGKAITRVRVNGKDFFGGDVKTATQQLPADLIDKVQIVDDYGDQANFTGIKDGDPEKILNIQIKPDKNKGFFGQGKLGQGNEGRYQANINTNYFNNNRQISVLGNLNNTNTSLFNFNGGGGGGRIQLGGGGGQRFGNGDGVTNVGSIGINYRDQWSKKFTSYGNYSYANRDNNALRTTLQQNISATGFILNDQNSESNTHGINHRFNWNFEYKIDSLNTLKVTPYFNLGQSNGDSNSSFRFLQDGTTLTSVGTNLGNSESESPNYGADVLFNHRFSKRGRTASWNFTASRNNTNSSNEATNLTDYYTSGTITETKYQKQEVSNDNTNSAIRSGLSYIEPLSRTESLEFNWNLAYTNYHNSRKTFGTTDPNVALAAIAAQTNDYTYFFMTNRVGMNYRVTQKKFNYTLGLTVQPTLLSGESLTNQTTSRRTSLNFIPVARYSYTFSRTREINFTYNGRNNEPSYNQLQPVYDISNPQFPVVGNPDLKAEFSHNINLRFHNFNADKGDMLFTNFSANFSQNRIVSNTIYLTGNKIETRYLNTDGYYGLNGSYNWSKPFAEKKYTISFNGSANYINSVNFVDSQKNTSKNLVLSQGASLQLNPTPWIELNPGANYSINRNRYTLSTRPDTKTSNWNFTFNGKIYIRKTWILGGDVNKTINEGYSGSLAVNPIIMNTYLEKQFLKGKAGSLRLQVFDVYNQNTNVSRTVNGNSITDTRSNRLARYAMLTLSLKLQKFAGMAPVNPNNMQMQMPGQGGGIIIRREGSGF
ncbi:MAG: outer membrane beta-barrel protein [Sphingobacteriaceae bacterium]